LKSQHTHAFKEISRKKRERSIYLYIYIYIWREIRQTCEEMKAVAASVHGGQNTATSFPERHACTDASNRTWLERSSGRVEINTTRMQL
jgi:hypothetical protein